MPLVEAPTLFERILTGDDVEQFVLATLRLWSDTYLRELERQHGYDAGFLVSVKGWTLAPTFDTWPEDMLPGVLVICTGLESAPEKTGRGVHRARWNVEVGACCSARTQQQSHEQAMLYLAAHRALMMQQCSLGDFALAVDWLDESYDILAFDDVRTLYAGTSTFAVEVDDVTTSLAGPATPDEPYDDPRQPWPLDTTVTYVDVDVEHVDEIDS